MAFEAEDPSEISKAGQGGVDRTKGAARAISVRRPGLYHGHI
jgi:L-lactate dehydrogenase (cytochrome)